MISVICVCNRPEDLERCLTASLDRQTAAHQRIFIDNSNAEFSSASAALNRAASGAVGDWLLFVHQDVHLPDPEWLARAEAILSGLGPRVGWSGVAGLTADGAFRGCIIDRGKLIGMPSASASVVQTLDECVLMHRRLQDGIYFDEGLTGWHAYGVDACCHAIRDGEENFVLPLLINHESRTVNLAGLGEAHGYVWGKHGRSLSRISTTCGRLERRPSVPRRVFRRIDRTIRARMQEAALRIGNYKAVLYPDAIVDDAFEAGSEVHVWHATLDAVPIEAVGFSQMTSKPKKVVHFFAGSGASEAEAVVIPPDLIQAMPDLDELPEAWKRPATLVVWSLKAAIRDRPKLKRILEISSADRVVQEFFCRPASESEVAYVIRH